MKQTCLVNTKEDEKGITGQARNDKTFCMKNRISSILLFGFLIGLSSCGGIKQIAIEIQEPAPITLPVSAQRILVMNNTVPQPVNYGIEQTIDGKSVTEEYSLVLDSAVWLVTDALSESLSNAHFFEEVSVYEEPIRTDTEWLAIQTLSEEIKDEFYEMEGFDALITIDRLLFLLNQTAKLTPKEKNISEEKNTCDTRVNAVLTVSFYTYGKKSKSTFSLSDSVFVALEFQKENLPVTFKRVPYVLINKISQILGDRAASKFIPVWKTVSRFIYTPSDSRLKEAESYANVQRWDVAESLWLEEFEKRTNPFDKARIASNIAVANEIQDKLEVALRWAEKARDYFENTETSKYLSEKALIKDYVAELQQRVQDGQLLDMQLGSDM
jgi:hypothetical protein